MRQARAIPPSLPHLPLPDTTRVFALWCDWALLCNEASLVIATRLWKIGSADPEAAKESYRMIAEKIEAVGDVWYRLAQVQWSAVWSGSWPLPPEKQAGHALGVYRKKVRANLRRLTQ